MSTAVLTAVAWAYRNGARHIGHKSDSGVASGVAKSPPNQGRHDGGHPDVSAAVEGRLDRGGGHARFPEICDRRQRRSRDLDRAVVPTVAGSRPGNGVSRATASGEHHHRPTADRKSTRLNFSHTVISYAV